VTLLDFNRKYVSDVTEIILYHSENQSANRNQYARYDVSTLTGSHFKLWVMLKKKSGSREAYEYGPF